MSKLKGLVSMHAESLTSNSICIHSYHLRKHSIWQVTAVHTI